MNLHLFDWLGSGNRISFRPVASTTRMDSQAIFAMLRWFAIRVGVIPVLALAAVSGAQSAHPIGYEQIYAFLGGPSDGEYLFDSVIEGSDGRLYGTTVNGGPQDGGLVFAVNRDGSGYVILHHFLASPTNGLSPWGGVIQGSDGRLYGATRHGGASGAGTVFSLGTNGTGFTIERSFSTNVNEGAYPLNSVIEGSDGRLYGRTISGGTNDGSAIFGMNRQGTGYLVLHSFDSKLPDFTDSYSGLMEGRDGWLYGTTYDDGAFHHGSVFRLNKDGTGFRTLHDFQDTAIDGGHPYGSVTESSDGVLYGVTSEGGPDDYGTFYRVNRDGTGYAVLRYFTPDNNQGYLPVAPPVEGPGDLLYGTTYFGGLADVGTIYRVRKDGSGFTFLYEFQDNNQDGWEPNGPMIRGSDGALYGTTFYGGGAVYASIFRIKPVALRGVNSPGGFTLHIEGFAGHEYSLEAADALPPSWREIAGVTNVTGTANWTDSSPGSNRFYRARVLNP